jgi:quercetin dioxygenase-like cupin family protein
MGDVIAVGELGIRFLVDDTALSMFEVSIPAGARVPAPHSHDAFEETIYGLEGVSTWTVDGAERSLGPGEAVLVPRGVVHGFVNAGREDAKVLAVATPGVFGPAYFRELEALFSAGGPPDPAEIGAIMRRHGLTPAG